MHAGPKGDNGGRTRFVAQHAVPCGELFRVLSASIRKTDQNYGAPQRLSNATSSHVA